MVPGGTAARLSFPVGGPGRVLYNCTCMDAPAHAEVRCALCGALAATLDLSVDGVYEHVHYMGDITERVPMAECDALAAAIRAADIAALYRLNPLWAPFYCPECDRVYCRDHWRVELSFEDEPGLPGWYDCAHGSCPAGHRRLIDD